MHMRIQHQTVYICIIHNYVNCLMIVVAACWPLTLTICIICKHNLIRGLPIIRFLFVHTHHTAMSIVNTISNITSNVITVIPT